MSRKQHPPRDCIVLTARAEAAEAARRAGFFAVHVGGEGCPDAECLRNSWSRLSCRNPSALVLGPPELAELSQLLVMQTQVNNNTGARRSRRWVEHLLRNVHHLAESPTALSLANRLRGVPCFVVGAGPSLERNAHLMPEARRRGVVVTVNSASRVVDGQAVLTVESNPIMAKVEPRDSARLYAIMCDPEMLRCGSGPLMPLWAGELGWVLDRLTGLQRIPVSGSGSTAAVALAHLWGCSPIVLVGQDLAYTDGQVYAPATGFGGTVAPDGAMIWNDAAKALPRPGNPLPEQEELEPIPAWGGGEVQSGPTFRSVIRWLSSAAVHCAGDGLATINATEGGADVPGWAPLPLRDVLDLLAERSITPADLAAMADAPPLSKDRLRQWLETEAPDDLLEPWAMPAVREALDRFRARPALRPPLLEAFARWRFDRKLRSIERASRREIRAVCG